jgi:hypothetical protein
VSLGKKVVAVPFLSFAHAQTTTPHTLTNDARALSSQWFQRFVVLLWWWNPDISYSFHALLTRFSTPTYTLDIPSSNLFSSLKRLAESFRWYVRFASPLYQYINPNLLLLAIDLFTYSDDLHSLLWFTTPQTYLVILQNSSEKRPNWWFFGSFAVVTLWRWKIISFDLKDSYLPLYHAPNVVLDWPMWLTRFLPHRDIHFVWANKIWFTYADGWHIQKLYEKTFVWQKIRGVIFLRTDMFTQLIPEFEQQIRERQLVNAATDMIRGTSWFWKKELYKRDLTAFLQEKTPRIIKNFLLQWHDLIQSRYINIYLDSVSWPFHSFLRKEKLTTRYEIDTLYVRDSNISYNKIDTFIEKSVRVRRNDILIYDGNDDILPDVVRDPGSYRMQVTYYLSVPDSYLSLMKTIAGEYGVTLSSREEHILGMRPQWDNRWLIYLPNNSVIYDPVATNEALYFHTVLKTPFSHAIAYKVYLPENNTGVTITFRREQLESKE